MTPRERGIAGLAGLGLIIGMFVPAPLSSAIVFGLLAVILVVSAW